MMITISTITITIIMIMMMILAGSGRGVSSRGRSGAEKGGRRPLLPASYLYIYIYTYREREGDIHIWVYICLCIYIYIYIYIHTYICGFRRAGVSAQGPRSGALVLHVTAMLFLSIVCFVCVNTNNIIVCTLITTLYYILNSNTYIINLVICILSMIY